VQNLFGQAAAVGHSSSGRRPTDGRLGEHVIRGQRIKLGDLMETRERWSVCAERTRNG